MKSFVTSTAGIVSIVAFVFGMGIGFYRITARRQAEKRAHPAAVQTPTKGLPPVGPAVVSTAPVRGSPAAERQPIAADNAAGRPPALAENAAYLDRVYSMRTQQRQDRDRQGNPITRRVTAGTPSSAGLTTKSEDESPVIPLRASVRLQGRNGSAPPRGNNVAPSGVEPMPAPPPAPEKISIGSASGRPPRPKRFNPYGNVIRCELVFTIDSTNEQTPLVGIAMEPVYNNGEVVIPAGAELHGVARPDRLRDRIFSGEEWVLVFPRDGTRPNGCQLNVRGVALDRIEPDATGVSWGITDGSYGLEGKLIRTMQQEEIKRFAANFFSEAAQTLQSRDTGRRGQESLNNTPQNAVLQGFSANLQKFADDITAEIERNGVFIRVPAGHQFYFYPMQIIDPDAADVSANIATVK